MGCGPSKRISPEDLKVSPSTVNLTVVKSYQPKLFSKLETEFVNAIFKGKSSAHDDEMLGQLPNFKHTSIHIDFDSRKGPNPFGQGVMIPPHKLSGVAEVSGYDFNKGKGPYVLIVPDWLGQLSPFISIIKFLQNEGFRVIAFNLYETHTQGFGGGEGGGGTKSNNIAAFIFSLFAEIDQKYNPACVVSFGAGSNWVLNAFSYGIFSKNSQGGCSNILICPVDDFAEYVERICELLHIQKSAAMLESIGTRLGLPIPPQISSTKLLLPKSSLLLHSRSSRQLEISKALHRAMNRCLVMECELNGMDASDYETNLFGSSSTLDKIMSFLSVNAFGANLGKNGSLTALNNHSRSMESMGSMTGSRNRLDTPPQRKNSRAGMIHLNPSLRKSIPEWEEMENEIVASGTPNTAVQVVYGPPFKSVIESFPPPMIKDSARSAGKNRLVVPMEKSMPNRASDVSLESLLQHIEKDFPVETNNNN